MIPILIVKAYRLIPAPIRRIWSFGLSTSHLALAAIAMSDTPWRTLLQWGMPQFTSIGVAWKLGEGGKGAP